MMPKICPATDLLQGEKIFVDTLNTNYSNFVFMLQTNEMLFYE